MVLEEKEDTEEERAGGGVAGCFPEIRDKPFVICCFIDLGKACEIKVVAYLFYPTSRGVIFVRYFDKLKPFYRINGYRP